jgi:hypothetical protein
MKNCSIAIKNPIRTNWLMQNQSDSSKVLDFQNELIKAEFLKFHLNYLHSFFSLAGHLMERVCTKWPVSDKELKNLMAKKNTISTNWLMQIHSGSSKVLFKMN